MTEAFRPTPAEFEAIVRFRAECRIQMKLRRLETGTSDQTDDLVMREATDRLSELAEEIGEEEVEQIVSEVEEEYRQSVGDEVWRVLNHGTPEEQAAFFERGRSPSGTEPSSKQAVLPAFEEVRDAIRVLARSEYTIGHKEGVLLSAPARMRQYMKIQDDIWGEFVLDDDGFSLCFMLRDDAKGFVERATSDHGFTVVEDWSDTLEQLGIEP